MFSPDIIHLLACPACKHELTLRESAGTFLLCRHCNIQFPVKAGIPVLMIEAAEPVDRGDAAP